LGRREKHEARKNAPSDACHVEIPRGERTLVRGAIKGRGERKNTILGHRFEKSRSLQRFLAYKAAKIGELKTNRKKHSDSPRKKSREGGKDVFKNWWSCVISESTTSKL